MGETIVCRAKEGMTMLGIGKDAFYELVQVGRIRAARLKDKRGKPYGNRLYSRRDVLKLAQELARELG